MTFSDAVVGVKSRGMYWVAVTMDGHVLISTKKAHLIAYLAAISIDPPKVKRLQTGVYEAQVGESTVRTFWITNDSDWLRQNGFFGDVALLAHPAQSTATGAYGRLKATRGVYDRHGEVIEFNVRHYQVGVRRDRDDDELRRHQAYCACGWGGPMRDSEREAETDRARHGGREEAVTDGD